MFSENSKYCVPTVTFALSERRAERTSSQSQSVHTQSSSFKQEHHSSSNSRQEHHSTSSSSNSRQEHHSTSNSRQEHHSTSRQPQQQQHSQTTQSASVSTQANRPPFPSATGGMPITAGETRSHASGMPHTASETAARPIPDQLLRSSPHRHSGSPNFVDVARNSPRAAGDSEPEMRRSARASVGGDSVGSSSPSRRSKDYNVNRHWLIQVRNRTLSRHTLSK